MKYRRTLPRPRMPKWNFTLIEALVVIIIVGTLAAVVLFAVGAIQATENDGPDWTPAPTTTTSTTAPVALLTCKQLDDAGYDGLASCIDESGDVIGPGQ